QTFKTLCLLNYALMIRHDYDITSSLRRGVSQLWYSEPGYETVGSKDLTCEDWMVNTRTDTDFSTAVQNALQTLLPQIRAEIREEFRTSSGPSDAGGNPPPATAPVDAKNWISHMEKIFDVMGSAGTEEEQAKNFQWGLRKSTLNHLICMSYTDVAQVANAARNYEILH
nr:zinc finger, CCHC-type, retrotransposon Gag domain protein [Tanacetum cinerariifolium]